MVDRTYRLVFTKRFTKDFRKLSKQNQVRVRNSLDDLKGNPYRGRKLQNAEIGKYRWRVGTIRIRYDIEDKDVVLLRVLKREDVYRR